MDPRMTSSHMDFMRNMSIGTIEHVSAGEVSVSLDGEAPQSTALNSGTPTAFPRINGYLLIPVETGALVGMVSELSVERSSVVTRFAAKNAELVGLPVPSRRLTMLLVGTLVLEVANGEERLRMRRGVFTFPSIGDAVTLPTHDQLRCVVESDDATAVVGLGTAPLAGGAPVKVSPNRLFARHTAVMGNTGSGKSCTVAGLVRWSLDAARRELDEAERVNARFIVVDSNGEYESAFKDRPEDVRLFRVILADGDESTGDGAEAGESDELEETQLRVPTWMWNSEEWAAFTQASAKTQRPLLNEALRGLRSGAHVGAEIGAKVSSFLRGYRTAEKTFLGRLPLEWKVAQDWGRASSNLAQDADAWSSSGQLGAETLVGLEALVTDLETVLGTRSYQSGGDTRYNSPTAVEVETIVNRIGAVLDTLPEGVEPSVETADTPLPFEVAELPDYLDALAKASASGDVSQFISWLTMRIRFMLGDPRLSEIVNPVEEIDLNSWLSTYIGSDEDESTPIVLLDMSLVPSEAVSLVVAVISRMVFEALQRYRRHYGEVLPTVLILEEAHNFIHRDMRDMDSPPAQVCHRVFERIAREGRKFGLGLVLSSQRPSELSPTVLSQCNTFLLHRIVNDRDQQLVRSLVPDNLGGLLHELPSLPTGYAMLLGWAAEVPVLVRINTLPECHRPSSSDPDFWGVWTRALPRVADWGPIVSEWQRGSGENEAGENSSGVVDGDVPTADGFSPVGIELELGDDEEGEQGPSNDSIDF